MKNLLTLALWLVVTSSANAQTFQLRAFDQPDGFELSVSGNEDIRLQIEGFEPGDQYGIQLRHKPGEGRYDYGALPDGTQEYHGGFLSGTATGPTLDLCLEALQDGPGTVYLTLRKNRGFDRFKSASSPFTVTNSKNLDSLLNVVFRNESCFELFPDTIITGDQVLTDGTRVMQTGVFSGGTEVFGMESGIIMSTGAVTDAIGPNTFAPRSQNFTASNNHVDPDAASLVPPQFCSPTPTDPFCYEDVAIIEFEFVPTTDTISFSYIFFSEEYCFALNAGFGDAFAFFLEGPNVEPNGRANVARLPNGERVSSETLNHIETPSLFVDNSFNSFGPCTGAPNDPATEQQTSYDGFSEKLQIKAAVTPCERHVLKLMVIDALDFNLDSGILLEAGSFTAGLIADPEPSVAGVPGSVTPVEACDTATLTFSRLFSDDDDLAQPLPVNYNLITTGGGLNMATNNLDFELPASPFVIPAGDSSAVLKIPILGDADNTEGVEAFIIRYDGTCNCDQNRDTFWIQDATELVLNLTPDQGLCAGADIMLSADASGGAPAYSYEWPDGQTTPQINYTGTGRDTLIYISVVDSCGLMGLDSIFLSAPNVSASVAGDFSLCSSPMASIPVDVEGVGPFTINLEVDSGGVVTNTTYVISQDTNFVFDQDVTVRVTSVEDATGCGGAVSGTATVASAGVSLQANVVQPTCEDDNGAITLTVAGGNANHTFAWQDDGTEITGSRGPLPPGTYTVDIARVSDPTCTQQFTYELLAPPAFVIDSFDYVAPTCPGEDIQLAVVVSGGTPPYSFFWPDSMAVDSMLNITSQAGAFNYPVRITDDCGVEITDQVTIDLPVFSANLSGRFSLCGGAPVTVPVAVSGPGGDYTLVLEVSNGMTLDTIVRPFTQVMSSDVVNFPFSTTGTIRLLSITNAAGCTGPLTAVDAEVVDPQISFAGTVVDVICNGAATGSITLSNPGAVPLTFSWMDGPSSANRTGLTAGSYSLRISDTADPACFRDTTFTIIEPQALTLSINSQAPACPFEADTLAAVVNGGTAPYTFSWPDSISSDSLLPIVTQPGIASYPLSVTDACGVEVLASYNHDYPDVQASITGLYGICNVPDVDLPVNLSGSSAYTLVIRENNVERTLNLTGSTTINYDEATVVEIVSVTGADGCAGTVVDSIARIIDADFNVAATINPVNCRLGNDGAISLIVNGDPGAYDYIWAQPGVSGANPTGLTAGTYSVRIIDTTPAACFFDTFFVVTQPDLLTLTAMATGPINPCPGESVTLAAVYEGGGSVVTINWVNGTSTDSLFSFTTVSGQAQYPLEVSDNCGNLVRDTFRVDLPEITAAVSGNYSVCNAPFNVDVPFTFTGSTSYTFTIEENGVPRTLTVSGDTSLNYTVATDIQLLSVESANGCAGQAGGIANVTAGDFNVVAVVTDILCAGSTTGAIDFTINGNPGGYSYAWDNTQLSGNSVTGLTAGAYSVTATELSAEGCTWDTTFNILEPPTAITLLRDSSRNLSCRAQAFASATYTGGTGMLTYTWSNGTPGNILGEVPPGMYELTITDENSCSLVQTFNLLDRTAAVQASISATAAELSCLQPDLTLSAQQNTVAVNHEWQDLNGVVLGTTRTLMINSPGTYVVLVEDPVSGCSASDTIEITRNGDLLDLQLAPVNALDCENQSVDLTITHPGYTDPVSYEWRLSGTVVGNAATLPGITTTGTYEVTVIRQDNGCPSVATTEVIVDRNDPTVVIPVPVVTSNCTSPEVTLAAGGNPAYAYTWTTTNGNITGPTDNFITSADQPGNYTVTVRDTANGCTISRSVLVIQDSAQLTPEAGTDQILVCTGQGTILFGDYLESFTNVQVRWYNPAGEVISEAQQAFATEVGAFVFEAIHPESGCSSFDTVQVIDDGPQSVQYTLQQPPCPEVGGRLFVTDVVGNNGPFTFSSPTGEADPFGNGLRGLREGNNVLIVTDQLGCELQDTFQIFDFGEFTGLAPDVEVLLGQEAVLGVETNRNEGELIQWSWSNLPDSAACTTCPEPALSPQESFIALVEVVDSNGCTLTLQQHVVVADGELVYMPSAFSPNNIDGVNDIYTVFGDGEFVAEVVSFGVFNRWGNLVYSNTNFQVNDPAAGWDGMINGKAAQVGVYAYSVTVRYFDDREETIRGSFTLVR